MYSRYKGWGRERQTYGDISKFRVHIEKLGFCRVIKSRVPVLYEELRQMREPRRQSASELP